MFINLQVFALGGGGGNKDLSLSKIMYLGMCLSGRRCPRL